MNTDHFSTFYGVDVAKKSLEICCLPGGGTATIANTSAACRAWATSLRRAHGDDAVVVLEATAGYEQTLLTALWKADVAVARINPRRGRHYGSAQGALAKTDRLDARLLADFARRMPYRLTPQPDAAQHQLHQLAQRRTQLVAARSVEKQRRHHAPACLRASYRGVISMLDRQIADLMRRMCQLVAADAELSRRQAILVSMPGIGLVSGMMLLAHLPELGALTRGQIASLVGVAPLNNDSGAWRGQRHIWGGRSEPRGVLYMCSLVVWRTRCSYAAFRDRLEGKGKKTKVILVALMRKMIVTLNAMVKYGTMWQPDYS